MKTLIYSLLQMAFATCATAAALVCFYVSGWLSFFLIVGGLASLVLSGFFGAIADEVASVQN